MKRFRIDAFMSHEAVHAIIHAFNEKENRSKLDNNSLDCFNALDEMLDDRDIDRYVLDLTGQTSPKDTD